MQPKTLFSSPSETLDHAESGKSTITLEIYSDQHIRSTQATILNAQGSVLSKKVEFNKPMTILIDTNKMTVTKILANEKNIDKAIQEGFAIVAKVIPSDSFATLGTFSLQILKKAHTQRDFWDLSHYVFYALPEPFEAVQLKTNTIVRFGKQAYFLRIHEPGSNANLDFFDWNDKVYSHSSKLQGSCKICLSNAVETDSDQLVAPCCCSGSCGLVHFSCLKTWIHSKIITENSIKVKSYNTSKLECEVCKCPLPKIFQIQKQYLRLTPESCEWEDEHYLTLQKLAKNPEERKVFCVNIKDGESVLVGRHTENEVALDDMSVSRFHATIKRRNNLFYLTDNKSKFGTFVNLFSNVSETLESTLICSRFTYHLKSSRKETEIR